MKKLIDDTIIFTDIYEKIYSKLECEIIYVFLCGGNCEDTKNHQIRNVIKNNLENFSKKGIKVLYPESLFFNKDGRTLASFFRKKDLLELETILANNSNIVCIICESYGSATELGAFTNYKEIDNNELLDKLVVVTYSKYKKDEPSFISEGPIKRLTYTKKKRSQHKIYEYTDEPKLTECEIKRNQKNLSLELIDEFKKICRQYKKQHDSSLFLHSQKPIKNFIGLAYLILLLIYFYEYTKRDFIKVLITKELRKLEIKTTSEFELFYKLAINFLLEDQGYIELKKRASSYCLTQKGLNYVKKVLSSSKVNFKEVDDIRRNIMYNQMYKQLYK